MDIVRIPNFGINKFSYFLQFWYCGKKFSKLFGVVNLRDVNELGILVDDCGFSKVKRLIIPSDVLKKASVDFSDEKTICTDDEFKHIFFKRFGFELIDIIRPLVFRAINNTCVVFEYFMSEGDKKYFNPNQCEYNKYEYNKTKLENKESFLNLRIINPYNEDKYIEVDLSKAEPDNVSIYSDNMFINEDMICKLDKPENFQPSLF